jgi:hypothetical protein
MDDAAIYAIAASLIEKWEALDLNLSEIHQGYDQAMRDAMRVGREFEAWACQHVDFERIEECYVYALHERFGGVAAELGAEEFSDCLGIFEDLAAALEFPLKGGGS